MEVGALLVRIWQDRCSFFRWHCAKLKDFRFNKVRLMKKTLLLSIIAVSLVLSFAPSTVFANSSNSKWASEIVWGNNVEWQMVAPPGHGSAVPAEPLYVVAPQTNNPQSPANNDHLPGVAHDHVLAPPPHNRGGFNANWEVYLVLCVSISCTAVNEPGLGGAPLALSYNGAPLTNDAAIQAGVASGALVLLDSGIHFICAVAPIK
jgi:hypothetical protein